MLRLSGTVIVFPFNVTLHFDKISFSASEFMSSQTATDSGSSGNSKNTKNSCN